MHWLSSLDDLLYEVMSWLLFFPITLWRTIRHPLRMMTYAENELAHPEEEQYTDTLSPPLFLILALFLTHALGLAVGDDGNAIIEKSEGLAGMVNDQTSLLLLRLFVFSFFPLMMAAQLLRMTHVELTRSPLQRPFYAQCQLTAPFAFLLGIGTMLAQTDLELASPISMSVIVVTVLCYLGVEIRWFREKTGSSTLRAAAAASFAFLQGVVLAVVVALLLA
jgi:hypothetical protein